MSEREKALDAALRLVLDHDGKLTGADFATIHAALALPPSPAPTRDYAKVGRGHGPKPSAITIHGDDLRLFEAAPDMLAALEMVESCFAPDDNDATAKAVRLAIARATGREG